MIINSLVAMADDSNLPERISMMFDKSLGGNRQLFMEYLAKSKDPRAREAIKESVNDPELAKEAKFKLRVLGRIERKRATKKSSND